MWLGLVSGLGLGLGCAQMRARRAWREVAFCQGFAQISLESYGSEEALAHHQQSSLSLPVYEVHVLVATPPGVPGLKDPRGGAQAF